MPIMRGALNVSHGLPIDLLLTIRFILRRILFLRQFLQEKNLVVKQGLSSFYYKSSFF
jgi:ribosomal protein L16 Arg81 hydroxylase